MSTVGRLISIDKETDETDKSNQKETRGVSMDRSVFLGKKYTLSSYYHILESQHFYPPFSLLRMGELNDEVGSGYLETPGDGMMTEQRLALRV